MTQDELDELQKDVPPGCITFEQLVELFAKSEPTTIYVGVTHRPEDRIWKMDIIPGRGFNGGQAYVLHYPEKSVGGMQFSIAGEYAKSKNRQGWVFLNYWYAYGHMLRTLAKKP